MNQADRAFLTQMIPHHQAALAMAKKVLSNGQDPKVAQLAQAIIAKQSEEIAVFRKLLAASGYHGPEVGSGKEPGMKM